MLEPIRVLLVDDEEGFLHLMIRRLSERGFRVQGAASGREALAQASASGGGYDVAVIDLVMGPPNGVAIMQELRRLYPALEVIILTGRGDMDPGERAIELGAYRYMSKPLSSFDELAFNIRMAARFGRERQRSLTLGSLVRAGQRISGARSEQELYQRVYEQALTLLPCLDTFMIALWDELNGTVSFPFCRVRQQPAFPASRQGYRGITEYVIETGKPLLLPEGDEAFRREHGLQPPTIDGACVSEIVVPMFSEDQVSGTIGALTYQPGGRYTPEHLEVLQAIANQAAVALQNVRQLREAEQLRDAVARLAAQAGTEAVQSAIVREAHALISPDFTGLILHDEDGSLHKATAVMPEDSFALFDEPRQDAGVSRWVVENRLPRIVEDTGRDPLVKESVRRAGVRSMLSVPLVHSGRVLAILYAHSLTRRRFGPHDMSLLTAFATQAAAALSNAAEEEREIEVARRLAHDLGILTGKLGLPETMARLATTAKAIFRADTCRIAYVDPPTRRVVDWMWAEGDPVAYRCEEQPRPDGITNHVLEHGEPVFRTDARSSECPRAVESLVARGLQSFASLPLKHAGRIIAVLHLNYYRHRQTFGRRDEALLQAFTTPAAMALGRAQRDEIEETWQGFYQQIVALDDRAALYRCFAEHAWRALRADFAVFYPCHPLASPTRPLLSVEEAVHVGWLRAPWEPPRGSGGGVLRTLMEAPDGLLVVNDLATAGGRYESNLARREGVRAFVAVQIAAEPMPGQPAQPWRAGLLFLNYRVPTAFDRSDLSGLLMAGNRVAAAIQRLQFQDDLQQRWEQRNQLLRALVDVFQASQRHVDARLILERIASVVTDVLDVDLCLLAECDAEGQGCKRQGAAGLRTPARECMVPPELLRELLERPAPTMVADAPAHPLLRASSLGGEEGMQSAAIYPLRVEERALGLLVAGYRQHRELSPSQQEALELLASLAALVLHEAQLREELGQSQKRLERRTFLTWVSMLENTWRHSLVQKASAIRNYAEVLQRQLDRCRASPSNWPGIGETVGEIDRLAKEIAAAPPRVPQSWEMEEEMIPLAPLLSEIALREAKTASLSAGEPFRIQTCVDALGGAQVWGYRRWLIYAIETLLENARHAMPGGGVVTITGRCDGSWALVRIKDAGRGVPEGIRDRLFRELVPKEADRAGMGIGALLAAIIVEEHGGRIDLEETGPHGTVVLLRLPVKEVELP